MDGDTVTRRRPVIKKDDAGAGSKSEEPDIDDKRDSDTDADSKEARLTLMEEVLLLGLKDKEVKILS